ncbi:MAG: hypothetical protein LQ345_001323 [Seirophora villosa]|nr:MAG: hypothetical protein LQ345_001323 [Seirophora villosa]
MSLADALRAAWAEVLDVDAEEIEDDSNFVELGGDSVAALRLIDVATKHGIHLDPESIFQEGIFHHLLAKASSTTDEQKASLAPAEDSTPDLSLLQTCANACDLPVDMIEDVYLAPIQAARFFQVHQPTGAWLLQLVFQLTHNLDHSLACSAFEAIHDRNQAFRSRYLDLDGTIQCVVARTPVAWQQATHLEAYITSDRGQKVTQGQPAVRYALVREPQNTYIVWTAMHGVMDGWTRKLLCDDLADFLRDPTEFRNRPSRPSVKLVSRYLSKIDPAASNAFWTAYLSGIEPPRPLPVVSSASTIQDPVGDQELVREYPFQRPSSSAIRLSTMGEAAFALALSSLTGKSRNLFFYALRASRAMLPGADAIMGCLFYIIPTRATLRPEETVTAFLARVQDEITAVMRHEPFGMMVFRGLPGEIRAADVFTFNWIPRGSDLFLRDDMRAPRGDGGGGGALKVVRERFTSSTLKGLFYVYDNGESLRLKVLWDDRVFSAALVEEVMGRFVEMLNRVAGCGAEVTVGELLDKVGSASDRS